MRRFGFTLVELAVVLVIIGLLIGGVLVAISMINTAKIQKIVREYQQYQIMMDNFGTKHNYYPGDFPFISPAGNGDGSIYGGISGQEGEAVGAWTQLKNTGMLDMSTTIPKSSYAPDGAWGIGYKDSANTGYLLSAKTDRAYFLLSGNLANVTWIGYRFQPYEPMVKPMDAAAIDKKIDDGNPLLGKVMSTNFYGTGSGDGSWPGTCCILNTDGQYSADRTKGTYNPNACPLTHSSYSNRTLSSCAMVFEIEKNW